MSSDPGRIRLLYYYDPGDRVHQDRLHRQLSPLWYGPDARIETVDVNTDIGVAENPRATIEREIDHADVIVLLISTHLAGPRNSHLRPNADIERALSRHDGSDNTQVIPILIEPTIYNSRLRAARVTWPLASEGTYIQDAIPQVWYEISKRLIAEFERIPARLEPSRPQRLLFAFANPRFEANFPPNIAVGHEADALETLFRGSTFEYQWLMAANDASLSALLAEFRPDLLHVGAHVTRDGTMLLDGPRHEPEQMSVTRFLELVQSNDQLQCIFLNACHSSEVAKLVSGFCEHVIAMEGPNSDVLAPPFAAAFYTEIRRGGSIQAAFVVAADEYQERLRCMPVYYFRGTPVVNLRGR